jgi:hypothetical protein
MVSGLHCVVPRKGNLMTISHVHHALSDLDLLYSASNAYLVTHLRTVTRNLNFAEPCGENEFARDVLPAST